MFASINSIKNRFNKKELFILLNAFNLSKDGTKQIIAERIFGLNKTFNELRDIIDDETNGILCCICLNKGNELDMYTCKTCKEGIVCNNCINNDLFDNYDEKLNELCPICKISPMYSNYTKNQLKIKCDFIKTLTETNNISISEFYKIIQTIKEEQMFEQSITTINCNGELSTLQKHKLKTTLRMNISKLLSVELKIKNINISSFELYKLI